MKMQDSSQWYYTTFGDSVYTYASSISCKIKMIKRDKQQVNENKQQPQRPNAVLCQYVYI